jgi:outer membrane protein OmpA-like peptidoglycan-associated protein
MHAKMPLMMALASTFALVACQTGQYPQYPGTAAAPPATQSDAYANEQDEVLLRELRLTGVNVSRDGGSVVLNIEPGVLFPTDSAEPGPQARTMLHNLAQVLKRYPSSTIDVDGFTDTTGSPAYNLRLSEERAESVADVLTAEGVESFRIQTKGYGESFPKVQTAEGIDEPRNRRVEITITPYSG